MAEGAAPIAAAGRPVRGLAPPGPRARTVSALLAILVQLVFVIIWVRDSGGRATRGRAGSRGTVELQLWTLAGTVPPGTIHPDARRAPRAKPAKPAPPALPSWSIPVPALPKPEEAKPPEAEEPAPMSPHDADEFRRQWAQLQDDLQHKALDDAQHHGLQQDPGDAVRPLQRFGAAPPGPAEASRKPEAPRPQPGNDDSMFAGELCVSRGGGGEDAPVLALPCLGEGYTTDYGWESRVHAPRRGEPMPLAMDPGGRVAVRNHRFAAQTEAALDQARAELYRIGVTVRLVYLPDLKQPIELLSRDDRARALSAQVFASEEELARYLNEWAGNVRRWTAYQGQGAAPR